MLKREYRRLFFSWATLAFLIPELILTCVNYFFSASQLSVYINIYNAGPQEDLNLEVLEELIDSYNGLKYFFTYYNWSDEVYVGIILAFVWMGIFVTSSVCKERNNGYGCFVVSRCGYGKYYRYVTMAQSLYITTVWGLLFALQLAAGFCFGNFNFAGYSCGSNVYKTGLCLLFAVIFCFAHSFYFVCINLIVSGLSCIIGNKYLIQIIPALIFALLPLLLGDTLPSIHEFGDIIFYLTNPFYYLLELSQLMNTFDMNVVFKLLISMSCFLILSIILTCINTKKLNRNYL